MLGSCRNRSLDLFLLPLPVRRKRVIAAPLSRRVVLPPAILFVWIRHHLLVSNICWFHTRRPFPVFLQREIPEIMPFPVYLLRETPEMMEWLLLVALGVHFLSLLHSFLRVRKPEIIARFHFRFVDPIPERQSLFLLP
jgi:hypothetical protein